MDSVKIQTPEPIRQGHPGLIHLSFLFNKFFVCLKGFIDGPAVIFMEHG
jgi:hypothetical protein